MPSDLIISYLIIPSCQEEISVSSVHNNLKPILDQHLNSLLVIFATMSDLFNFLRYIPDEALKEKLKRHYNKNNILTQKSEFLSSKMPLFKNILLMDYFGMEVEFLKRLMLYKRKYHNIFSFVMNPDVIGNKQISFPYGTIVNNIIENDATDEELLIYLQLLQNVIDKETCVFHLNSIRNHLNGFQQREFRIIKNLNDYTEEIRL